MTSLSRPDLEAAEAAALDESERAEAAEAFEHVEHVEQMHEADCGCARRAEALESAVDEYSHEHSDEAFDEATSADERRRLERMRMRRPTAARSWAAPAPAALPFQVQVPLTGGAPALAMPIGGAGSPIAFSVPLGGSPAPSPAPAPAPAAATAPPAPVAPPAPAAALGVPAPASVRPGIDDAPLNIVTSIDFPTATESGADEAWGDEQAEAEWTAAPSLPLPEAVAGLAVLREAEAACRDAAGPRSSAQLVARLLAAGGAGERALSPFGGAAPSATSLFNAFEFDRAHALRQRLRGQYARVLRRLAGPGDALDGLALRAGDWLVRVALGQGFGQLSVVASPLSARLEDLGELGWRIARSGAGPGRYVQVVEVLPVARPARDRFARRVADPRGRLLAGHLLLRPVVPGLGAMAEAGWDESFDARSEGIAEDLLEALAEDAAADVRWLQDALNRVMGLRLAVDGQAGPQTRQAVRSFQSSHGLVADGIAGPRTLGALREALQGGGMPTTGAPSGGSGGGGGATGPVPDCNMLTHFPQGSDEILPQHRTLLNRIAARILADDIRVVLITGFASAEGGEAENMLLSQRRALRVSDYLKSELERRRPGSSRRVVMIQTARGESEQTGGDLPSNRRVKVCVQVPDPIRVPPRPTPRPQPQPTETQVFRIVAKSFIARIGSNTGSLDCGIEVGPVRIPGASNAALWAMARLTDQAFDEDPLTDAIFTAPPPEGKGYRLFSRARLSVNRRGTECLSAALMGFLDLDAGKECVPSTGVCLQAPSLIVDQPFSTTRVDASRLAFRWGVKGRPPAAVEPGFNAICLRDSVYIWHQVKGTIDCSSGSAVITNLVVEGSRFPSHRVWLDGSKKHEVRQGPFSNLWDSASSDPTRVR